MEMAVLIIFGVILVSLIFKRLEDKKKENFEDREY
tara:strand:- start:1266 stop:1370 length:105 start_codon:yes stop_codon:yes gene_type:complete